MFSNFFLAMVIWMFESEIPIPEKALLDYKLIATPRKNTESQPGDVLTPEEYTALGNKIAAMFNITPTIAVTRKYDYLQMLKKNSKIQVVLITKSEI